MLSLALAACSGAASVTVYAPGGLQSAGLYFAEANRRFREQGVQPRWSSARTEMEAIEQLAQGKLDAAILPVVPQLIFKGGLANHSRLVAEAGHFASPGHGSRGSLALFVSRELAASAKPDSSGRVLLLGGKSVALSRKRGSPESLVLAALLERSGMARLDIREVYMKSAEIRRGFKLETLDAALVYEPHATLIEKDGTAVRWLEADPLLAPMLNAGLFLSRKFMNESAGAAAALVRAYVKGLDDFAGFKTDPAGAVKGVSALQAWLALPESSWWREAARVDFERGGSVDETRLRATFAAYRDDRATRAISLEKFWDPAFLAQALASGEAK